MQHLALQASAPIFTQSVCVQIKDAGGEYLEAPVSGTKQPAEKGQLIFVCGGDKELYERATPLLDVMGKAKFYLGPVSPNLLSILL